MLKSTLPRTKAQWARLTKAQLVAELMRQDAGGPDARGRISGPALGEQSVMLQTLIEAIPAPVFYKDTDHIYRGCNSAFSAFIGLTKEKIIGASVYDVAPKDLADTYRAADDALFAAGGNQVYEAGVTFADGSLHDVMFHKAVFENDDGSIGGLIGVMLDITKRKRAEAESRESRELLEHLVEHAPDPIFVHDDQGKLVQVNENACTSLGYTRDELLAMNVADFETGPSLEELTAAWSQMGEGMNNIEGNHRRKDGSVFPVEVHVSRFKPGAGLGSLFLALARDISERKEAEAHLVAAKRDAENANRAKSEFLANMSHELRTPLNAILGFSEVIRTELLGPIGSESYGEYADDIHGSGRHLLQIINDMLDISRLEIDSIKLDETIVAVIDPIDACFRMLVDRAREKELNLENHVLANLADLICDSRRVTQILVNLVGNAIKFTEPGGRILVSADFNAEGGIRIDVADTGIGIDAADIAKVLLPFEQVESPMTRQHSGAGLGLALSKALAEVHGAVFTLESTMGEGTTVSISFPPERTVS